MAAIYDLIKQKRSERKKLAEQAQTIITKAADEKRSMTAAEDTEWTERHADIDKLAGEIEKLEKQDALDRQLADVSDADNQRRAGREDVDHQRRAGAPGQPAPKPDQFKSLRKYLMYGPEALTASEKRHFMFAQGDAGASEREMLDMHGMDYETRALGGTTATGDALIPQGYVYNLNVATKWYGGIINENVASYIDTTTGATMPWPNVDDTGSTSIGEVTAENQAVTVANAQSTTPGDPVFSAVNLNAWMYDSGIVKVPIQLLQDSAFNLEDYLIGTTDINQPRGEKGLLAIRIGRKLNKDCTTGLGSGSSQPNGVVTAASLGWTGASTALVTYLELVELEHSVDPSYRGSDFYGNPLAKFMFNDTTLKAVKKLVDSNNRPLWIAGGVSEGVQNRRPDTLNGYGYVINQDMASMSNNAKSILFGAFDKYKIRRVRGLEIKVFRELYMGNLQVGFMGYQRFDGQLLTAGNPVKYFANAAT